MVLGCSRPPMGGLRPRLRAWQGGEERLSSGLVSGELAAAAGATHGVAPPGEVVVLLLLLPTLLLLISRGLGGASNSLIRLLADTCGGRL